VSTKHLLTSFRSNVLYIYQLSGYCSTVLYSNQTPASQFFVTICTVPATYLLYQIGTSYLVTGALVVSHLMTLTLSSVYPVINTPENMNPANRVDSYIMTAATGCHLHSYCNTGQKLSSHPRTVHQLPFTAALNTSYPIIVASSNIYSDAIVTGTSYVGTAGARYYISHFPVYKKKSCCVKKHQKNQYLGCVHQLTSYYHSLFF
jgi:hypothetical protein